MIEWILFSFYSDDDKFILNEDEICAGLPHSSRQEKNLKNNFVTASGKDASSIFGSACCSPKLAGACVSSVFEGALTGEE